jgi:hypothetical protein
MPKSAVIGSRARVFHGNAHHTSGGLTKSKLVRNKRGRIVPISRQTHGNDSLHYLRDAGYRAVPGVWRAPPRRLRMTRARRGGRMPVAGYM